MTTVAQLIEFLKQQPQEAEVEVGYEESCGYDTCVVFGPVEIGHVDILNYTFAEDRSRYLSHASKLFLKLTPELA